MRTTQKQRLQDRIDQEPTYGSKLAARSVRIGPGGNRITVPSPSTSSNIAPTGSINKTNDLNQVSQDERKESSISESPVIGNVVERKTKRRSRPNNNSTPVPTTNNKNPSTDVTFKTGFPPILKQPIGTFLPSKLNNQIPLQPRSTFAESKVESETLSSINVVSENDATTMLQQMSVQEINETIEELHSTLKPETIQFLKLRQQLKNQNRINSIPHTSNDNIEQLTTVTESEPTANDSKIESFQSSKFQMAQVMTSIKTYDDIDAAYTEYMNQSDTETNESFSKNNEVTASNVDTKLLSYSIYDESILDDNNIDDKKFHIACTLLRSTSSQQTLWASRIVYSKLKQELMKTERTSNLVPVQYNTESSAEQSVWPFPIILPVALRCLLDANVQHNEGSSILQTTYVLQSIFLLLQLRACSDHVVSFPVIDENHMDHSSPLNALNYQVICLDDAIPTLPVRVCYAPANAEPVAATDPTVQSNQNGGIATSTAAAAYWTASSTSTSANKDGHDFLRDPMWTLLSTMKIIPRIAYLLQCNSKSDPTTNSTLLPIEARQSICGILAMIGQRSQGAASAIVNHPTILNDLMAPSFTCNNSTSLQHQYDATATVSVLCLLCTLARQSFIVAEGICQLVTKPEDFCPSGWLLHILTFISNINDSGQNNFTEDKSSKASQSRLFVIQQWAINLWRILLRYGLALDLTPTMITFSSSHLTLGYIDATKQFATLAPEWYSCFAVILHCANAKNVIRQSHNVKNRDTTPDDRPYIINLVSSSTWQRLSIHHLQEMVDQMDSILNSEVLRLISAIFLYWKALLFQMIESNTDKTNATTIEFTTILSNTNLLLLLLTKILVNKGWKQIISATVNHIYSPVLRDLFISKNEVTLQFEARSITLTEALLGLLTTIKEASMLETIDQLKEIKNVERSLARLLIDELDELAQLPIVNNEKHTPIINTARHCRLNRIHTSVISFLCRDDCQLNIHRTRYIVFTIIGRLSLGEESSAVLLFKLHNLFRPLSMSGRDHVESLISELLLRELCLTPNRQNQLNHSCKLRFDCIFNSGLRGLFDIGTLLSEVGEGDAPRLDASDHLLPVGKYWLWKLLSGDSRNLLNTGKVGAENTSVNVLSLVLKVIDELETHPSVERFPVAMLLSRHAKLYYLTNICLQGETLLSHDCIVQRSEKLLDFYLHSNDMNDIAQLAEECRLHIDPRPDASIPSTSHTTTVDEAQMNMVLNPKENNERGLSSLQMRSVETYVGDLCEAYMDNGLHYPLFTKSVRFFLAKDFPTTIRLNLLNRFRTTLHLLSLEDDKEKDFIVLLHPFISGGMPSVDQSIRDSAELLDGVASLYSNPCIVRDDDLFIKLWTICLLARSFGINIVANNTSGLLVSKRRICRLDLRIARRVINTTAVWLQSDGSLRSLIQSSLQSELDSNEEVINITSMLANEDYTQKWEDVVALLKSIVQIPVSKV